MTESLKTLDNVVMVWHGGIDDAEEREALRVYLADWFQRNGVDPDSVKLDEVCIAEGRVYFTKYLRNAFGRKYTDSSGDAAVTDTSHPITIPFGK